MSKFDKLDDLEIQKIQRTDYKHNEIKQKTFKDIINSDNLKIKEYDTNRVDAFNRIWENAKTLVRRRYSFGRNDTGLSFNELVSMFVRENTFYKSSILENFENANGKNVSERFLNAERATYNDRTKQFLSKYGEEKVRSEYLNKTKTLNDFFEDYKSGKISKEVMNSIIDDFKETNEEYLSVDYRGKNYESNEALLNDYFIE